MKKDASAQFSPNFPRPISSPSILFFPRAIFSPHPMEKKEKRQRNLHKWFLVNLTLPPHLFSHLGGTIFSTLSTTHIFLVWKTGNCYPKWLSAIFEKYILTVLASSSRCPWRTYIRVLSLAKTRKWAARAVNCRRKVETIISSCVGCVHQFVTYTSWSSSSSSGERKGGRKDYDEGLWRDCIVRRQRHFLQ